MDQTTIRRRLQGLRESRSLNQAKLADVLGFKDRQTLSDIELGKRNVAPDELVRRHCPERTIAIETPDERAAGALAGVTGVRSAVRDGNCIIVQAQSVSAMTGIIEYLATQRISVSDFQTFVPTLEDVFLRLTGHSVRQ